MGIVNTICEAIYAELIRENVNNEDNNQIQKILVDHKTYADIRHDNAFPHWCHIYYPRREDESIVLTIMGYAIVPTYEVEGFQILLKGGILAPKAAKGTAQN